MTAGSDCGVLPPSQATEHLTAESRALRIDVAVVRSLQREDKSMRSRGIR